jgi:hypothetical protein
VDISQQLSNIIGEMDAASERAARMQRDFSEDAWQRKPGVDRWSAIECVWHLCRTNEEMLPRIRESLSLLQSKPKQEGKYHLDFVGWFVMKNLSSKARIAKFKTTAPFIPKERLNVKLVLDRFSVLQNEMIQCIRDSDGLPLGLGRVVSPFDSRVKYNVYSAFRIVAVHEHRHLDQAERAAKS